MNKELLEVLEILGKEKKISKTVLLEAIENSLLSACNSHFGTSENIKVSISEKLIQSVFAILKRKRLPPINRLVLCS